MKCQHPNLASGRWQKLSLTEQMANIGSEVERAISWRQKKDPEYSRLALFRALELLDLTTADKKNRHRLKELKRVREFLVDYFLGKNIYGFSAEEWRKYFYAFNFAARNTQS